MDERLRVELGSTAVGSYPGSATLPCHLTSHGLQFPPLFFFFKEGANNICILGLLLVLINTHKGLRTVLSIVSAQ